MGYASNSLYKDKFSVQYYPDLNLVKKYKINVIVWGNQLKLKNTFEKRKKLISKYFKIGIDIVSIDIALKKEGIRFLCSQNNIRDYNSIICGDLAYKHNFFFWKIINSNPNLIERLQRYSIVDIKGNFIFMPYHLKKGKKIPFVSIFSNEYENWIKKQFNLLLRTGANAIHVDEPLVGIKHICKHHLIDYSEDSIKKFKTFLKKKKLDIPKRKTDIQNYYREFCNFSLEYLKNKYFKYFREKTLEYNIYLSSNLRPSEWYSYEILNLIDFLAPEIKHTSRLNLFEITPLVEYKFANYFNKYVIAVPYPMDWKNMIKSKYSNLEIYTYWIGEAVSTKNILILPFSMWTGNLFKKKLLIKDFKSKKFSSFLKKLKEEINKLSNYKIYSEYTLIIPFNSFKEEHKDIIDLIKSLIRNNILFSIKIESKLHKKSVIVYKERKRYELVSNNINIKDKIKELIKNQSIKLESSKRNVIFNILFNKDNLAVNILNPNISKNTGITLFFNRENWKSIKVTNIVCFPRGYINDIRINQSKEYIRLDFSINSPWCILYLKRGG